MNVSRINLERFVSAANEGGRPQSSVVLSLEIIPLTLLPVSTIPNINSWKIKQRKSQEFIGEKVGMGKALKIQSQNLLAKIIPRSCLYASYCIASGGIQYLSHSGEI